MSEASHVAGVFLADHLQQLTEKLAATHTQQDVLTAALRPAMTALKALAGAILLLDPETQVLSVAAAQGKQAETVWQDGPLSSETPAGDVLLKKAPLYFEHAGALKAAYPHLEEQTGGIVAVATTIQPLLLEGQPLGALILDFRDPHIFTPEEKPFLASLAAQCSVALSRAQLIDRLQASETAFRRLVEISPVGMGIGSLDGNLTLVNDAWLNLLGQTRAAFESGQINWQTLTPPEYAEVERRAFETVLVRGEAVSYDKEMLTPTGERVPFQATMARFDDHQVVGYAMDLRPFQAQQRLLEQEGARLEQLVEERTGALEEERASLAAFVNFTEAVGVGSDTLTLVRQAVVVLQATLPSLSVGYYERVGEYWVARAWSEDVPAEVVARMQAGVPAVAPDFAQAVATGFAVFADHWDAPANDLSEATMYGAAAFLPLTVEGRIRHLLSVAIRTGFTWSERERGIVRAVASSLRLALERMEAAMQVQQQRDEAESRARALEAFEQLSRDLVHTTDRSALIRRAQEVVLSLLPSGFAVYYELEDGRWQIKAQTGDLPPEVQTLLDSGLPFEAPSAYTPWTTGTPLYQDVYAQGSDTPPEVSAPVKATFSAPLRIEGERVGVFSVGLFEQRSWPPVDRVVLSTTMQSLELALERAAVAERLIRQNAELDARTEALEAFARFTEASTRVTDVLALAEQAKDVLRATLGDLSVGYYELEDGQWKARVLSEDIPPATAQTARAGFPFDVPSYARPFQERGVVFTDARDAEPEEATDTKMYGAGAFYPYFDGDAPYSLFSMGTAFAHVWTERERDVFLSISRSLGLALERAYSMRRIQLQSAEVESRNRALEAFSTLTGVLDVRLDRYELIRRTQELVLSLLPPGYAAYFEPEHGLWRLKSQVGDAGQPALQAAIDIGFPVGATPTLDMAMNTGEPYFVDVYVQNTDIDPEVAGHLNAAACLPLFIRGQFVGIFNVPLFHTRAWNATDRAVLISAIQSLMLALEGAQSLAELGESNQSLQEANGELEAFTYSASHDLRTPVRHVMGFAELAQRALEKTPNEKASQYLDVVKQGATRMTDLIDAMLLLSRSGRQELHVQPVDLNILVAQARRDVATEFGQHPVHWQVGGLPTVQGDHSLLQQVMTNLLSNAVKYSAKREVSEVEVWCEESASEWRISVKDNGAGFDPNYAQKLFGIFQRLHTDKEFKGTGVGLATMRRIVQKHGGRVFAESDGQTGATFGFTLLK